MNEKFLSKTSTSYENYEDYLEAQVSIGLSFESDNIIWSTGQEKYIEKKLAHLPRDIKLADIACGDGVGLRVFKDLGFTSVEGFELSEEKALKAKAFGFPVYEKDIHDLSFIENDYYDVIYSSHTLEHLLDPLSVLCEFKRILKSDGQIYIVLPYGTDTEMQDGHWVHCGVESLGLNIADEATTLTNRLEKIGYEIVEKEFDNFRESEVWLKLKNNETI